MYTTKTKIATGTSYGKIILIGEHSAVYEKPAIAIPCTSVKAKVTIKPSEKGLYLYCDLFQGYIGDIPNILNSLQTIIQSTLIYLHQSDALLHITIDSSIPLERGMGSSAAVSAAIIRALFNYYNVTLQNDVLLNLLNISERMIHGNPSGLDASIVTLNKPIMFQKNQFLTPISFHLGGYLIIADSHVTGKTKLAIQQVKTIQEKNPILHHNIMAKLGELTTLISHCLISRNINQLGTYLNDAHILLQQLNVSHPKIDQMVTIAKENGAIGSKMTGGGLGGCIIAIAKTMQDAKYICQQLKQLPHVTTYIQSI